MNSGLTRLETDALGAAQPSRISGPLATPGMETKRMMATNARAPRQFESLGTSLGTLS